MDAITLITNQHREVERLFGALREAEASAERERLFDLLDRAFRQHAAIEESLFYPAVRDAAHAQMLVLEFLEEHHLAEVVLDELIDTPGSDPLFAARLAVLENEIKRHVREEEGKMLPMAQRVLDAERLQAIGQQMQEMATRLEQQAEVSLVREYPVEQHNF